MVKKIFIYLYLVGGMILLSGCPDDNTAEKLWLEEQRFLDLYVAAHYPDIGLKSSGLLYQEHQAGTGISAAEEDWVKINYVAYRVPEEEVFDTYLEHVARDNRIYNEQIMYGPSKRSVGGDPAGLTEGLSYMKEGGQSTMIFSSDLGFGPKGNSDVEPYQSLKYEVELLEVIKDIESYEETRFMDYVNTIPDSDTIHDPLTGAIMYFVVEEQGEGDSLVIGSNVDVDYIGYLMDGRVFDQSNEATGPFEIGENTRGWDMGLLKFNVGGKGRLIIPYQLAYGDIGVVTNNKVSIPPYEALIFDIEIIEIVAPGG